MVVQFDIDGILHDRGVLVHFKLSIGIVHEWLRHLSGERRFVVGFESLSHLKLQIATIFHFLDQVVISLFHFRLLRWTGHGLPDIYELLSSVFADRA